MLCPPGTFNVNRGSTSLSACLICPAGAYCLAGCSSSSGSGLCRPGSYSTAGSGTSAACTACPAGTYNENRGSTVLSACTECPAGSYCLSGCNSSSGSGLCAAGTYSTPGSGSSAACTPCPGGLYCLAGCASSGGSGVCAAGSFSVTGSGVSAHCTKCPAGAYCFAGCNSSGGSGLCGAGSFSILGSGTKSSCSACPGGKYCLAGCSSFDGSGVCGAGSYSVEGSGTTAACSACPAGAYCLAGCSSSSGSGLCRPGSYSTAGSGTSAACTACPAGTYNENRGSTALSACLACPSGHFCVVGASVNGSGQCQPGSFSTVGSGISSGCTPCNPGFYSPSFMSSVCLPCLAGTFSAVSGSSSVDTCLNCPQGSFCPKASANPTACPYNTWSSSENAASASACIACPSGTFTHKTGVSSSFDCATPFTSVRPSEVFATNSGVVKITIAGSGFGAVGVDVSAARIGTSINGHSFVIETRDIFITVTIHTGFDTAVVLSPSNGPLEIEFVIFGRKFLSTNSSSTRLLVLAPILSVLPSLLVPPAVSSLVFTVTGAGGFGSSGSVLEGKLSSFNVSVAVISDTSATINVPPEISTAIFSTARAEPVEIEVSAATGRRFRSSSAASRVFIRSPEFVQMLLTLQADIALYCPTCSALSDFKATFCSLMTLQLRQLQIVSVYAGSVNILLNVISVPGLELDADAFLKSLQQKISSGALKNSLNLQRLSVLTTSGTVNIDTSPLSPNVAAADVPTSSDQAALIASIASFAGLLLIVVVGVIVKNKFFNRASDEDQPFPLNWTPELKVEEFLQCPLINFQDVYLVDEGSFGRVYRCNRVTAGSGIQTLAVKVFKNETADKRAGDNFIKEGKNLIYLKHANIISVESALEKTYRGEKFLYIVMEMMQGKSLKDHIIEHRRQPVKRLGTKEVFYLYGQIRSGLCYLRDRGIVHLDVKPENILTTIAPDHIRSVSDYNEPEFVVKLSDFGLARDQISIAHKRSSVFQGTLAYTRPERKSAAHRPEPQEADDVYAFALVIAELATNQDADFLSSDVLKHLRELCSPQLCTALCRALHPSAVDRVETLDCFHCAIELCRMNPYRWEIDANLDGQWQTINCDRTHNLLEYSLMKCKQTKNMTGLAVGVQVNSPPRERILNGELCLDLQQIIARESGVGYANQRLTGNCEARLRRVFDSEGASVANKHYVFWQQFEHVGAGLWVDCSVGECARLEVDAVQETWKQSVPSNDLYVSYEWRVLNRLYRRCSFFVDKPIGLVWKNDQSTVQTSKRFILPAAVSETKSAAGDCIQVFELDPSHAASVVNFVGGLFHLIGYNSDCDSFERELDVAVAQCRRYWPPAVSEDDALALVFLTAEIRGHDVWAIWNQRLGNFLGSDLPLQQCMLRMKTLEVVLSAAVPIVVYKMIDDSEVQRYNNIGYSFSWSGFVSALSDVDFAKRLALQGGSMARPSLSPLPPGPLPGRRSHGPPVVSSRAILRITTSSVLRNLHTVSPFASPHEVLFVPSNLRHYSVTSAMRKDPAHPGVEFIDVEERDGPCKRGCEPPPPSPEKDIFMLLARPDIHTFYTGTANAEVEFVDVDATSPFYHFVLDQMRQPPPNFRLSRISIVRTRREAAFCSEIIRESEGIAKRLPRLIPKAPDPLVNADFKRGLDFFNSMCEETFAGVCDNTKVMLAWHGTGANAVESVCRDGPRAFRTTDGGYFGAGSYFAVECAYASRYSEMKGSNTDDEFAVILFACFLAPFPYVITLQDDYLPRNVGPWDGFSTWFSADPNQSKGIKPLYNAHFAPVKQCGNNHPVAGQPLAYDPSPAILDFQACSNFAAEGHELILENFRQALPLAILWYKT
jgi:serine/threonine protein kinase